ncbi:MAG: hypothetical protein ACK47B_01135 [Armatimonadota bacterium]
MVRLRSWLFASFMLLVVSAAAAETDFVKSASTADPRLSRRESISGHRIYVAELLEKVTAKWGVPVSAEEGAGDYQVTLHLTDVPLSSVMDGLWSLLSRENASWKWIRSGDPGEYEYRLIRPLAARQLPGKLRAELQADFESHADAMLSALDMTPEEQRKLAERDPAVALMTPGSRLRDGLQAFSDSVSPEQRTRVLRGEDTLTIPVDQLSDQGKSFVHSIWSQSQAQRRNAAGGWEAVPPPANIRIYTRPSGARLAPTLFIALDGLGGYGYLGGNPFEKRQREKMDALWMLPGDAASHLVARARISEEPAEQEREPRISTDDALARRLDELADAAPLDYLALLPRRRHPDPGSPRANVVEEFLDRLYLQRKWRGDLLLLTYPTWFTLEGEEGNPPWSLVKSLRDAEVGAAKGERPDEGTIAELRAREKEGGGWLTLRHLAWAAATLTEQQLTRLAEEFPVMANVAQARPFLAVLHHSAPLRTRLASARGVGMEQFRAAVGTPLRPDLQRLLSTPGGTAVRIRETEAEANGVPVRRISIEILGRGGRVVGGFNFTHRMRSAK